MKKYEIKNNSIETKVNDDIIEVRLKVNKYMGIGEAYLHPDDKEHFSNIFGYELAKARAYLDALKTILKYLKIEQKTKRDFISAVGCYKNFDSISETAKALYRQYNRGEKEIEDLKNLIDAVKISISEMIDTRDKLNKQIENRTSKK